MESLHRTQQMLLQKTVMSNRERIFAPQKKVELTSRSRLVDSINDRVVSKQLPAPTAQVADVYNANNASSRSFDPQLQLDRDSQRIDYQDIDHEENREQSDAQRSGSRSQLDQLGPDLQTIELRHSQLGDDQQEPPLEGNLEQVQNVPQHEEGAYAAADLGPDLAGESSPQDPA